jgi:hypothetical protein
VQRFAPLAPLKEESSKEHFYEFIAKTFYKISGSRDNDAIFENDATITRLISLTAQDHKIGTRTYAVAAMRNEASSSAFRAKLVASDGLADLMKSMSQPAEKVEFFVHITGLFRNLIADPAHLDILVQHHVHLLLFGAIDVFPDSSELAFNCFRVLTKASGLDSVRCELLERYSATGFLTRMLSLIEKHKGNPQILTRLAYVFADFAAREPAILTAAGKCAELCVLGSCLEPNNAKSDRSVTAMVVQVIANLSVDADCAAVLSRADSIARAFENCTFGDDDRLGFNLLCAASNFTYHDRTWCPPELINAIPVAIVSKHIPSILESLRTLCNLALAPNAILIKSKIPEMLGILLKHVHSDVVLYSLQTLANLANHEQIRQRFNNSRFLDSLISLFAGEEMDELQVEAIAALVMNFGTISAGDASLFARTLDDYEFDGSNLVITAFIDFLNRGVRSI